MTEQNFGNHVKLVPPFHFYVLPVLLINVGWSFYLVKISHFSLWGMFSVVVALAILLGFLTSRMATLTVQNRVTRLEERLRYQRLLPADLQPRIGEFTVAQLVSLRFASDTELPVLARRVLDENLNDRKAIKQLIENWKPDHLRA